MQGIMQTDSANVVSSTMVNFAIGDATAGLARLEADIASGHWAHSHADLLAREQIDCGYRLVVAGEGSGQ